MPVVERDETATIALVDNGEGFEIPAGVNQPFVTLQFDTNTLPDPPQACVSLQQSLVFATVDNNQGKLLQLLAKRLVHHMKSCVHSFVLFCLAAMVTFECAPIFDDLYDVILQVLPVDQGLLTIQLLSNSESIGSFGFAVITVPDGTMKCHFGSDKLRLRLLLFTHFCVSVCVFFQAQAPPFPVSPPRLAAALRTRSLPLSTRPISLCSARTSL